MAPSSVPLLKFDEGCSKTCFSFQNFAEDKLREELRKLQEDKCQYQGTAKESLHKMLQEKLEAVQKMQDLERYSRSV
jgi:Fe-S cluster biogenesis protein NfuA